MISQFIICSDLQSESSKILQPAVIAAIIAAVVTIPGILLSLYTLKNQRLKSERDEIYKKLNSFYGPIRLQLKTSKALYDVFAASVNKRTGVTDFRTLPFILDGKEFSKTEKTLLMQILNIGKNIEKIIEKNAGLIDSDDLHNEMIKLGTHLRIIREAYNGNYTVGDDKEELLEDKTFPDIIDSVDDIFKKLKGRLDELNKK